MHNKPNSFFATILLVVSLTSVYAVQLSQLFQSSDFRFYAGRLHTFPDGTLLVSAGSTYPVSQLNLHPIVKLDDNPSQSSETFLVARVQADSSTVIWAAAISTLENTITTTIDPEGNSYVAGFLDTDGSSSQTSISIIKFAPDGERLYTRHTNDGGPNAPFPSNLGLSVSSSGTGFQFVHPKFLMMPAEGFTSQEKVFAVLVFDARTGDFVRSIPVEPPKFIQDPFLEYKDFTVTSDRRKACFALLQRHGDGNNASIIVQCVSLKGKANTVSRELELSGRDSTVFSLRLAMEDPVGNRRKPAVRVAYERALDFSYNTPGGNSTARHELIIYRLETRRLNNIAWTSRKKDKKDPMVVLLPTSFFPGEAVQIQKILHAKRTDSFAMLLATTVRFESITQAPGGGNVEIDGGKPFYLFPPRFRIMSFDQSRKISVQDLPSDPSPGDRFNYMIVSDYDFSVDETTGYVYGFLERRENGGSAESGPLFYYGVPTK